ncbi:uncharacterized protein CcaverHIS019_0605860 [Cutaneotrichosporon cavernicola]|uniref:Uncharacterized protein n=1 Tax=Cutaneotrichosporon cavernicola TaxID=279322 RepID=A0AA48QY53_9TREE|nr:uncharacterized protein CcaverHIS019_0605860 [Cutaneotrichosporon cavernicola]BEI94127.1 hypothetical protein CcaverHIS019_0605860 [Cutaneotrichosporon cavernicola]BEJ01906.1 hypothetical protein CcaverHIS631_0605880 [Cutaneotrichosporon cavernicola]BEJ09672.1 hypothetical protein CcaverHIS641_0605870 [Cutaneotrichosporon cavernicola]
MTLKQYYQPDSKAQAAYPIPIPVPAPAPAAPVPYGQAFPPQASQPQATQPGYAPQPAMAPGPPAVVIQAPPDKTGVVAKTAACCGIGALFAGLCMLCTEYCVCDAMFYA